MNASVNTFIDQIKANGELAKIHQKWMKLPLPSISGNHGRRSVCRQLSGRRSTA